MSEVARKLTAVDLLERFAKDIEAFHRGGSNLKARHLQLVDELGLPETAAAKWKEKVEVEWDEAEQLKAKRRVEARPKAEPDWLKFHQRLFGPKPAPAKPANDEVGPQIEAAPSVSAKPDFAKELDEATAKQKADAKLALEGI